MIYNDILDFEWVVVDNDYQWHRVCMDFIRMDLPG